jgi:hypothetical protein
VITAEIIRSRIGDFTKLERQPAKLGARLAQAFSTTDPSIELQENEIEVREDIEVDPASIKKSVEPEVKTKRSKNDKKSNGKARKDGKPKTPESDKPPTPPPKVATEFTDGYGAMSLAVRDEIWKELNPNANPLPEPVPSAFQVSPRHALSHFANREACLGQNRLVIIGRE